LAAKRNDEHFGWKLEMGRKKTKAEMQLEKSGYKSGKLRADKERGKERDAEKKEWGAEMKDKIKELRAKAEAKLDKKIENLQRESGGDLKVLHELRVHQIELEMQNEELSISQKQLEDSRTRYSDLYDFAPVGYVTIDQRGLIIEANLTVCQMLGIERTRLIHKPFHLFVSRETKDEFYKHHRHAMTPGTAQTCQVEIIRRKNGQDKFYAQLESAPVLDTNENVICCRTIVTDITEQKKIEHMMETIRQQTVNEKNRLAAIMESLPVGIAIVNEKGGNYECNSAFEKVWGSPPTPAHGFMDFAKCKAWWVNTGEALKSEEWASSQALLKGKTVMGQLLKIQRFDGREAYVLNSAAPIFNTEGKVIGSVVAMLDITKQTKVEEALTASRSQLQSIIDNTEPIVYMFDLEEKFILANKSLAKLVNSTPEKMIGKRRQEFMDLETALAHEANDQKVVKEGRANAFEEYGTFNGKNITFLTSKVPIRDAKGNIYAVAGISADITDRKEMEETIKRETSRFAILSQVASNLLGSRKPQEVLNELCVKVMNYLESDIFINFFYDAEKKMLRLNACAGVTKEIEKSLYWLDLGDAVCGNVAKDGKRVVIENIEANDPRTGPLGQLGIEAYACHPIIARGKVIGTLAFGTKKKTKFSEDDLAMMKTVTDQIAVAMERVQAEDDIRRNMDEMRRFNEAMIDREMRMVDLKREINELCLSTGKEKRYVLDFSRHKGPLLFKEPPLAADSRKS